MTSHTIQSKNYSSRDTVGIFPMEFTLDGEQFLVMKDEKEHLEVLVTIYSFKHLIHVPADAVYTRKHF